MGMKNRFQEAVQNVQRQRHLARRSVAMVLVLAMLTAMSVSWRLHQDGIALAADDTRYYCGKEEHKHTDDCYIEGTEPICGYEEGEIVEETMDSADDAGDGDSSAADWDEAGSEPESEPATQEEPEPEVVLHHHTADCYEEEEVLTCGIESDHVHQDYCYDQETGELLCTEHEHTDDCYTLEEVLVCGQEEGEPEKTDDGAALYDMDENSAEESDSAEEPETVADPEPEQEATKPETDDEIDTGYTVHHHTAECYGKVLICGKEEHEHTAACLVNPNAEIDAEYDAKTPDRTSVDWAQDMVLVARSQLGYTESKADVDEDGNGYTMYADQYYKDKPMVYADWDSTFVAYCLYHAGVPQDIIPQYASISALRGELARMNSEYYTDDPQEFASILPGDIVMYKNAEGRETIGVVSDAAVDEETDLTTALTVISGDVATGCESDGETTIDQVAEVSVALSEVTSFVSVNAAEGYGISDLMDGEQKAEGDTSYGTPLDLSVVFGLEIKVSHTTASGSTDKDLVFNDGDSIKVDGKFILTRELIQKLKDGGTNTIAWDTGLTLIPGQTVENEMTAPDGTVLGTYYVGENGQARFVFTEAAFQRTTEPTIKFGFDAEVRCDESGEDKEIAFPGGNTTITVKKPSDVKITKESDQQKSFLYKEVDGKQVPYLHFKVKVSSEKGTNGQKVEIKDQVTGWNAIKGKYDETSFKLTKDNASINLEGKINVTKPTDGSGSNSFDVKELDALNAGESYVLEYDYLIDQSSDGKLIGSFGNAAKVLLDGEKKDESTWDGEYKKRLEKSWSYNQETNRVTWTIIVRNPDGSDLKGYQVKDLLDNTTNKEKVTILDGKVTRYNGDKEDTINNNPTDLTVPDLQMNDARDGFTYTFPENSKEPYYKLVYVTRVPKDVTSIKNGATIDNGKDGDRDSSSTTATTGTHRGWAILKAPRGSAALTDTNDKTLKKAKWFFTVKVPDNVRDFTASDVFLVPTAEDRSKTDGVDDHYAILSQLKAQLEQNIKLYAEDGKTYTAVAAREKGVTVEYKFYKGYTESNGAYNFTDETTDDNAHVKAFTIHINSENTPESVGAIHKLNAGMSGSEYTSFVKVSQMTAGKNWRIQNHVWSAGVFSDGYYNYKKELGKNSITKRVSDKADNFEANTVTISHNNNGTTELWYQLYLETDGTNDTITIKDTLDKGLHFDDSTWNQYDTKSWSLWVGFKAGNSPDSGKNGCLLEQAAYNDYHGDKNNVELTVGTTSDDKEVLTIKLKNLQKYIAEADKIAATNGKEFGAIVVIYRVVVEDNEYWNNLTNGSAEYHNHALWVEKNLSNDATAKVTQDSTCLEKTGMQLTNSSNGKSAEIKYTLEINKERAKINPQSDTITLTDEFTVPDRATAKLDNDSIKLTKHLQDGERTEEVKDYTLSTSVRAESQTDTVYTINMTVDDATWYTLEYIYKVDMPSTLSSIQLENRAKVTAKWTNKVETKFEKVNGYVSISESGYLRLTKVEKGKEQNPLQNAKFTLYRYSREKQSGEWIEVAISETAANGTILYAPGTETGFVNLNTNTLYKLVETEAPTGYVLDSTPHYFIWMSNGKRANQKSDVQDANKVATGKKNATVLEITDENMVQHYNYGEGYDLKVTNAARQLEIAKRWKDADGNVIQAPQGVEEIKVKVYKFKDGVQEKFDQEVTLTNDNGWKQTLKGLEDGYQYRIEEQNVDGKTYTVSYTRNDDDSAEVPNGSGFVDGDKVTITNQLRAKTLTVKKYWQDDKQNPLNTGLPGSVTIQLYKKSKDNQTDEKVGDVVTLTEARNWSYIFTELDPDALYYVKEEPVVDGFTVTYDNDDGVNPGGTIKVINTASEAPTYELPSTGSPGGTVPYTAGGAAIALAAVLCGYNSRRKRKRGEE